MNPLFPLRFALALLLLSLLLHGPILPGQQSGQQTAATKAATAESFICPPCGAACHFTQYPKAGSCGGCGMELVPLATVPQVGVLLYENADLISSTLPLALFASSNAARTFAVADTAEPLRLDDTLELRAQFAFSEAPPLDVLVLPDGFGAWDDPMLVEWVKGAAEHARFVLATGSASILLARAGLLKGEHVPGRDFLVRNGQKLAPDLVFETEPRWRRSGKFFLARDPLAALDAGLAIVQEMAGADKAQHTADALGLPWKPEAAK